MDDVIFALTLVSALGCGLVAGAFFAFSTFVMRALGRLPAAQGIAAMQSINVVVINPWFMTVLFGPVLTCPALAVLSVVEWEAPESIYLLVGSALYIVGTILVTMAFNVPRNDVLAAVEPGSTAGEDVWRRYVAEWTVWNHVRTVAALATTGLFTLALR